MKMMKHTLTGTFGRLLLIILFGSLFNVILIADELPEDYPAPIITESNNPGTGYYFIGMIPGSGVDEKYSNYIMVLDPEGNTVNYNWIGNSIQRIPLNFMQTPSGQIIHVEKSPSLGAFYISDTTLTKMDSINNLDPDVIFPYFQILPNGHYILILFEFVPYDLSLEFEDGNPNATIRSSTIYEWDKDRNIVFKWRALDNFKLSDTYEKTNLPALATPHTNNLVMDYDGNLLLSSRHISEVTKINRQTGEIVWRLGGKNNEFEFINEHEENAPTYFSYQHDIRRLANGNISLFDNGTQHEPKYSRGVEYELDEVNKTATMVWEYRPDPDIYAVANGSCQRLDNDNILIGWGEASSMGHPGFTELNPDNSIAMEVYYQDGFKSMRAVKYPYAYTAPAVSAREEIQELNTYDFENQGMDACVTIKINELVGDWYPAIDVKKYNFAPMAPDFEDVIAPMIAAKRILIQDVYINSCNMEIRFDAECLGLDYTPESYKVYMREEIGSGKFSMLETEYDEETNELIVNTTLFGEFVFGIPQEQTKPGQPTLFAPANNAKVNKEEIITLSWLPKGYFTASQLQVSLNEDMSGPMFDIEELKTLDYSFDYKEEAVLYWRVRSVCGDSLSEWSEIYSFEITGPYYDVLIPDGGESWAKDSERRIIRWGKNIEDLVKIELMKDDNIVALIIDSLECPTGGYSWIIPDSIDADSSYKVKVSSVENSELYSISDGVFAIADGENAVDAMDISNDFNITNYPNPFNNSTSFEFTLNTPGLVNISYTNLPGSDYIEIYNEFNEAGTYKFDWNTTGLLPGVYFCKMTVGNSSKLLKIVKN